MENNVQLMRTSIKSNATSMQIFQNAQFGEIRIVLDENNVPWFCLSDVCKVLGLIPSKLAQRLDKDVLSKYPLETAGGIQQTNFVNEDGLYDAILDSRKTEAKQIRKWVTGEILPSIRKYGIYATPQTIDNILADPDNAIKILTALKEERKKNKLLEDQNHVYQSEHRRLVRIQHEQIELLEVQAPKVEYANNILNSTATYTTTQIAKELGVSAQYLNFTLKSNGVIEKKGGIWTATENYIGKGYLTVKSYPYRGSSNRERTNFGTVWTEAGRNFIHSLIDKGTLPFK
jgi:prophage antirepressor-like protein